MWVCSTYSVIVSYVYFHTSLILRDQIRAGSEREGRRRMRLALVLVKSSLNTPCPNGTWLGSICEIGQAKIIVPMFVLLAGVSPLPKHIYIVGNIDSITYLIVKMTKESYAVRRVNTERDPKTRELWKGNIIRGKGRRVVAVTEVR